MTPLPEILEWIASHANKFRRPGYEPPNHLTHGVIRHIGADGSTFDFRLDGQGRAPDYEVKPVIRLEIYAANGELLFAEDA
jgi:hypothetical protein